MTTSDTSQIGEESSTASRTSKPRRRRIPLAGIACVAFGAMLILACVGAVALIGCGTGLFPPGDGTTETADAGISGANDDAFLTPAGLAIGRLRIESLEGVFVLSDAAVPKHLAHRKPTFLAWWNDFAAREMFVFDRLVETQGDVGHALLNLERDLEIDLDFLIDDNPALNRAVAQAAAQSEDATDWRPATYALALDIMGFDAPDSTEADAVDAVLFVAESDQLCIQLKSNMRSLGPLTSFAEPLKAVTFAVNTGCGGSGGGPPTPTEDCPGDIDCDGVPDFVDPDIDGDGIPNITDPDVDGDGVPNGADPDVDGDGVPNGDDNDVDGDTLGNGGDSDIDGDGIGNASDPDVDGDGLPNADDPDTDGDGLLDEDDPTPGGCTTDCSGACCTKSTGVCRIQKKSECLDPPQQFHGFDVVCIPNPCCTPGTNPTFPPGSATVSWKSIPIPSSSPDWGQTATDDLNISISAVCDGTEWCAVLDGLNGIFTEWCRLFPGVEEVTGPGGNTAKENFCPQASALDFLDGSSQGWYMLQAVCDHEDIHATRLLPALQNRAPQIEQLIEAVCVPHTPGMTETDAKNAILASGDYQGARANALRAWSDKYGDLTADDHDADGPTEQAEHAVVDPMVANICSLSSSQCWFFCNACPPRETGACCAPQTGVCNIKTNCDCLDGGGVYRGDDITCGPPNPCKGACCLPDDSCQESSESRCTTVLGGTYNGDGTTCATVGCGPPA